MTRIGVFSGDVGGANEVVGVGLELEDLGHEVDWRVSPENDPNGAIAKAGIVFDKFDIKYSRELPTALDRFELIVIGTSATATELQIAGTEFANVRGIPCIHVEDFPGCANYPNVRKTCSPDVLCVVDEASKRIALNVRPNLDVRVCGKPSYSEGVGQLLRPQEKCDSLRKKVRYELGFTDDTLVIVASLGVTAHDLVPYLEAISNLGDIHGRPTVLLSRIHPKTPEHVKAAASEVLAHSKMKIVDSSAFNLAQVVIGTDIFVCTWGSTEQFCATLAGVVPLINLEGEKGLVQRNELGYRNGVPPIVESSAGWGFDSTTELVELIENASGDLKNVKELLKKTSKSFESWVAPGATQRIVDVCLEMLPKKK